MPPTAKNVLSTLQDVDGYITIAATLGNAVVPLGKWLASEFKAIGAKGETITFVTLVQQDTAELEAIAAMAQDDITAINAELAKIGKPPIATVPPPAP